MAKRTVGAERIFNLGQYQNIKWIELLEFDDSEMDQDTLDMLRYSTVLNLYMSYALHQTFIKQLKKGSFDPPDIMELVAKERSILNEAGETAFVDLKLVINTEEE